MKSSLSWLALIAILAIGCKKGSGDECASTDDCKDGLSCVTWSDAHSEALGDCSGDKCCASKKKAKKAARGAECSALIAAIEATRDVAGLDWKKPDDLEELARKLNRHVKAYEAVDVTDAKLTVLKDDYIQMARELAESAEKRALGVNQFDGPVVFGETKRMKAIGKREKDAANKLNELCKAELSPVLRERGAGIAK